MKVAQYENTDYEPFLPPTRASLLPMSRFILIRLIFTSSLGWVLNEWITHLLLMRWIAIYLVDTVIQLLNNGGQLSADSHPTFNQHSTDIATDMSSDI